MIYRRQSHCCQVQSIPTVMSSLSFVSPYPFSLHSFTCPKHFSHRSSPMCTLISTLHHFNNGSPPPLTRRAPLAIHKLPFSFSLIAHPDRCRWRGIPTYHTYAVIKTVKSHVKSKLILLFTDQFKQLLQEEVNVCFVLHSWETPMALTCTIRILSFLLEKHCNKAIIIV